MVFLSVTHIFLTIMHIFILVAMCIIILTVTDRWCLGRTTQTFRYKPHLLILAC
jgi:hypothetical protein